MKRAAMLSVLGTGVAVALAASVFSIGTSTAGLVGPFTGSGQSGVGGNLTSAQVVAIIQDAGTLARADEDLYAASFNATGFSADGGTGGYVWGCGGPDCKYKLAEGSSMELRATANSVTFNVGDVTLPTTYISAIANRSGSNLYIYNDSGKWTYLFPTSDTTGCAAGTEGGIRAYSTTHGFRFCDGTTVQTVAFALANTASVDFASMANGAGDTKTMTVTGATTSDVVTCSPVGGNPEAGLVYAYDRVTAADTVTLARFNISGGVLDPAAINYKCAIVRAP